MEVLCISPIIREVPQASFEGDLPEVLPLLVIRQEARVYVLTRQSFLEEHALVEWIIAASEGCHTADVYNEEHSRCEDRAED